jgi:tetratricopeptide (TPR) repeat protein
MKYIIVINIFLISWTKFNRINEMNTLKQEAFYYYMKKDYDKSIAVYEKLLNEYKETDERVKLNLANSFFHKKKYNSAIDNYKQLIISKDPFIKSVAYLQLGVIYSTNNKKELGLGYFKEALKAMPENEAARYNFELLKKEHDRQQKDISPDKKKENSNGENKTTASNSEESRKTNSGGNNKKSDSSESSDENGEDENTGGEEEEEILEDDTGNKEAEALQSQRLEEMHMNERQARMILKTMKSAEIQYIQQKKKIIASKPLPGKPDW